MKSHGILHTIIPSSHPTRSPDHQHGSFSEGASFGAVLNILACWVDCTVQHVSRGLLKISYTTWWIEIICITTRTHSKDSKSWWLLYSDSDNWQFENTKKIQLGRRWAFFSTSEVGSIAIWSLRPAVAAGVRRPRWPRPPKGSGCQA